MATGPTVLTNNPCYRKRRRMLLLLADPPALQQAVQLGAESILHPKALREAKDDDKYNSADPAATLRPE